MTQSEFHEYFMHLALVEAQRAANAGEVPTGCVIVALPEGILKNGELPEEMPPVAFARIIGRGHNQTEQLKDASAHAEILAISAASATHGDWRLENTLLYVTKEPCPMCAGAIVLARPAVVVWGFDDERKGGESQFGILSNPNMNHHPKLVKSILFDECKTKFQEFFKSRREERKSCE